MSNKTVVLLKLGFRRVQKTTVTGTRVRHVVKFNPNTANPKDKNSRPDSKTKRKLVSLPRKSTSSVRLQK